MGQLEKYGLYVLCLLIFLILGVTLWGSGTVAAQKRGVEPAAQHLKATTRLGDDRAGPGGRGSTSDSQKGGPKLPNFRELLTPAVPPKNAPPNSVPSKNEPPKKNSTPVEPDPAKGGSVASKPVDVAPPEQKRPTYTIRRGDRYESIAREQFGDRALAAEIARLNPRQDPRKLIPGKEITMPTQAEVDAFLARRVADKAGVEVGGTYIVRRGDTLGGIAVSELGTSKRVAEIQALNPGVDPINMRIGTKLRMPRK